MKQERISQAQGSKNLGEVGLEQIGDVDIVRAMGMVAQAHPLGVSLWRCRYAGDMRELPAVLTGLMNLAGRHGKDPEVVPRVVRHWLHDVCEPCQGRGYLPVPGTPMLSEDLCPACEGSGRAPLANATADALWVLEQIASAERLTAAAIMRKTALDLNEL